MLHDTSKMRLIKEILERRQQQEKQSNRSPNRSAISNYPKNVTM